MALLLGVAPPISSSAFGQFLTVFGGPAYDATTGNGYHDYFGTGEVRVGAANDKGIAVSSAEKAAAGENVGDRAIRWDASGASGTELGHLGTDTQGVTSSGAYDINAGGVAVGWADKYIGSSRFGKRAVRWDASGTVATELGNIGTTNGYTDSRAFDINDSGVIVGYADKRSSAGGFGSRAVRWNASGIIATELGNLGTSSSGFTESMATAVNDAGVAVGYAQKYVGGTPRGHRAVRWSAGSVAATELDNLGVDSLGYSSSYALAINSTGTIVGRAAKYSNGTFDEECAVRWEPGATTVTELDSIEGGFGGTAFAINDAGVVVGASDGRAVRWDAQGTDVTELSHISDNPTGQAWAINAAGFIVGYENYYVDQLLYQRAVLWKPDATAIDLNTLIAPDSGWTLAYARSITDTNWITGVGSFDPDGPGPLSAYERDFLLNATPIAVPEPQSLVLAVTVLTGLICSFSCRLRRQGRPDGH